MTRAYTVRFSFFALLALALVSCVTEAPVTPGTRTLAIGGLFSITGNWNTLGKAGNAAAELAVEDVNKYFFSIGSNTRVTYRNLDTKLEPTLALESLRAHHTSGSRVVVGPQSSAEVSALKAFADSTGVIVISPSSTAGSLALPDYIVRMSPADIAEGPAIVAMMQAEGRTSIIPLWRDDIGNAGLKTATSAALLANGATVHAGLSYATDVTDFTATINALRTIVSAQIAVVGADKVGIYNPGFDEVATMFGAIASDDTILRRVRWYGGDGTAMSAALLPHAEFCTQVGYANPLFGIGDGAAIAGPVAARIKASSGIDADAYSLSVYDAIWIAARTYDAYSSDIWTPFAYYTQFDAEASRTFGVTGWTKLNHAGDRAFGNFDMMAVRMVGGSPTWVRVGTYSASSNTYTAE